MGYMSHVSSVTREVELKISVLLILKTTLHVWFPKMAIFVKKRLRWKQSEQRREYLFLTWPIKMIKMFQSKTINIISINVHLRTTRVTLHKNRLLGNLQEILNSHFLTWSSLFFKS